ncbi:MAG TPA: hypothetical protein VFF27_12590 [Bacteroidia bacterium]|jgi:hypothetical protein|nr:hypothetical protein [Bacteroidia bacterium]
MAKVQKLSSGEKTAKVTGIYSTKNQIIAGVFLITGIFISWLLNRSNDSMKGDGVQNIKGQNVDTGAINNYNAKGDIKVENNTYNGIVGKVDSANKKDTVVKYITLPTSNQKKDAQVNVTSNNQSGGQTANQINNNH